MKEYHKIQSVFLRDPENNHKTFLEGQYALPEFYYLENCSWQATEKVDGTNIRVGWDGANVRFGGKTDNAQVPTFLLDRLQDLFPAEKLAAAFPDCSDVTLYGEGFGAKIQKGGGDYGDPDFILFDVLVGGWWLLRDNVEDVAGKLGCRAVPRDPAPLTLPEAVSAVRRRIIESQLRATPPEGLVLRPYGCELFTRKGERIITKLKLKDFPEA